MNYNHQKRNISTVSIQLMCAIVFCFFSFSYLYYFQADILAVAQHVLSKGLTHYNGMVGAVLITLVLQLLQLLVFSFIHLTKRSHALTYIPSMLVLAFVTDINSNIDQEASLGAWWWVFPLVLLIWYFVVLFARGLQDVESDSESTGLFSRAMWLNMLTMAILLMVVVAIGNTNAVFHYRMRAESCLLKGDFEGALEPGRASLESDADLLMIRMYALTRTGKLGESLFNYPISGNSSDMLPVEGKSHFSMYPTDSLYSYLGARPGGKMTNAKYLELMQLRDSTGNKRIADYQLCGLLIDRNLDGFVKSLRLNYVKNDTLIIDSLPKYYREAMTLYTHLRSHPALVYHNAVMDEDWSNLQELERKYPDKTERKGRVEEQYRGTYWYYYEYE